MDEKILAALIAGLVSLTIGVISFFTTRWKVENELRQTRIRDILQKRIEAYPRLWSICIRYEAKWGIEGKKKDRDWVGLLRAVDETRPGEDIDPQRATKIRDAVYGKTTTDGKTVPGLSTHLKDDLGSYHATALQRRVAPL